MEAEFELVNGFDYAVILSVPVLLTIFILAFLYNNTVGYKSQQINNWRSLVHSKSHSKEDNYTDALQKSFAIQLDKTTSEGFSVLNDSQSLSSRWRVTTKQEKDHAMKAFFKRNH